MTAYETASARIEVYDATKITFHMFHWYSYCYTDVPRPSRFSCEGLACETTSYHRRLNQRRMSMTLVVSVQPQLSFCHSAVLLCVVRSVSNVCHPCRFNWPWLQLLLQIADSAKQAQSLRPFNNRLDLPTNRSRNNVAS